MKSVMALVLAGSGVAVAQDVVQWRVEDGGNGHWYRFIQGGEISFPQARSNAIDLGGDLVVVDSPEEYMDRLDVSLQSRRVAQSAWSDGLDSSKIEAPDYESQQGVVLGQWNFP